MHFFLDTLGLETKQSCLQCSAFHSTELKDDVLNIQLLIIITIILSRYLFMFLSP